MHHSGKTMANTIKLPVEGGTLKVSFDFTDGTYSNVFLIGPARFIFKGSIELNL
jgi:diaminopimelate epimerase